MLPGGSGRGCPAYQGVLFDKRTHNAFRLHDPERGGWLRPQLALYSRQAQNYRTASEFQSDRKGNPVPESGPRRLDDRQRSPLHVRASARSRASRGLILNDQRTTAKGSPANGANRAGLESDFCYDDATRPRLCAQTKSVAVPPPIWARIPRGRSAHLADAVLPYQRASRGSHCQPRLLLSGGGGAWMTCSPLSRPRRLGRASPSWCRWTMTSFSPASGSSAALNK